MSMYLSLHQLGIQINDRGVHRTLIHDVSLELAKGEIGV
jgi:hypothetical protein